METQTGKALLPPKPPPKAWHAQPHTEPRGQGRHVLFYPIFPQASRASRACCSLPVCQPLWALLAFSKGLLEQFKQKEKKKKRQNEALRWEMSRPAQCSEVASWHQRGHILPVLADGTGADTVLPSSRGQHPVPVLQARSGPPVPARGPRGRGSPPAGHHLQHRGTHLQPRASCWVGKALPTQPNPPKNLWITPKTRLPRGWAQPSWSSFPTSVIPQLPRARHLTCCCFIFTRKKNQDKRQFPPQPPT